MARKSVTKSFDSVPAEPPAAATLAPGDRIDGVYRIERLLGEGGAGAVYLVCHEGLEGARFALKVLHRPAGPSKRALVREGRLASEVRSAHVVKVAALGQLPGGRPYLVMEYVEGPTLDELLADRDLVTHEALDCGRQLCLALEAAHAQGLVHGDVSLRNLFVTTKPDGSLHVQLGDFGLARRVKQKASTTISLDLGTARGTPRFMSPEAISGDEVDARSDVFAAGVVIYRLLCGAYPFDGESAREILTATLRGAPLPLAQRRSAIATFEAVVMRCLASDPALRFQSARELREALEAVQRSGSELPRRSEVNQQSRRRGRFRPVIAAAAVAVVSLAAWVGLRTWREQSSIPLGPSLECPDTSIAADGDAELARAVAQAACARVGAGLDLDWGGGPEATRISTRLVREPGGSYRLDLAVVGRTEVGRGETPLATAAEAARRLLARARRPAMSPEEIRLWGASDAETAVAVRAVWRRRTVVIIDNPEEEPRAVLARDPGLPLMQFLLAEVEREPIRRRDARRQALANADRLPPERAAALRGSLAVAADSESPDAGLEQLRRAYSASPGDLDIGVLYVGALVNAGRAETANAVIEQLRARFPRRSLLALHYGTLLPERTPDQAERLVGWQLQDLPESRGWTDNICLLTQTERLDEADAASAFARRLGLPEERRLIPEALLALAIGDPPRIERTSVRLQGSTLSWAQRVGVRMRLAALLITGQVASAQSFLLSQIAARRTGGDEISALYDAIELLQISRRIEGPSLRSADLDWFAQALDRTRLSLSTYAAARSELMLARVRAGSTVAEARTLLDELDAELVRRAGADALALAAARLRTLALVRLARGDAEAAERWRGASAAWLDDRVRYAFDAAFALEAASDSSGAEAAYRLAAMPYSLERHAVESIAARLRLADLIGKQGRDAEARALLAHVERAWSGADHGLRERVRGPR